MPENPGNFPSPDAIIGSLFKEKDEKKEKEHERCSKKTNYLFKNACNRHNCCINALYNKSNLKNKFINSKNNSSIKKDRNKRNKCLKTIFKNTINKLTVKSKSYLDNEQI